MSFCRLMKIHFLYLFSKKNIIILSSFAFIIVISNILIIRNSMNMAGDVNTIVSITWETAFSFDKLLLILMSSYVMSNFCLPSNDEYRVLFLIDLKNKEKYYLSKIYVLILVITLLTTLIFLLFIMSFLLINEDFKIKTTFLKGFILIYLQLLVYGLLSSIFAIILRSALSSILSFIIYLIIDYFNYEVFILNTFFPLILFEKYEIFFGNYSLNMLVISAFYFVVYTLITRGKNY